MTGSRQGVNENVFANIDTEFRFLLKHLLFRQVHVFHKIALIYIMKSIVIFETVLT